MIAGVLLNETPRVFGVDPFFEWVSKGIFDAQNFYKYQFKKEDRNYNNYKKLKVHYNILDKLMDSRKYPTVGIAQVSPISAIVEEILKKLKIMKNLGNKRILTDDEMATIVGEYNTREGTKYGDSFKYNLEYIRRLLR